MDSVSTTQIQSLVAGLGALVSNLEETIETHDISVSQWLLQIFKLLGSSETFDLSFVSKNQVRSKLWAKEQLINAIPQFTPKLIHVHCGWYGLFSTLFLLDPIFKQCKFRSFDLDASATQTADHLNRAWVIDDWRFKAATIDVMQIMHYPVQYTTTNSKQEVVALHEQPDLVVNTSCEHLPDFFSWRNYLPSGRKVLLQSNDFFEVTEHINCVNDLKSFKLQAGLSKVFYEGSLNCEKYTRFMLIGEV